MPELRGQGELNHKFMCVCGEGGSELAKLFNFSLLKLP